MDSDLFLIAVFLTFVVIFKIFMASYWAKNYDKLEDYINGRHTGLKSLNEMNQYSDWSGKLDSDFIGFVRTVVRNPEVFSRLSTESQALLLDISAQTDALPSKGQIYDWSPVTLEKDLKRVEELQGTYLLRLKSIADELTKNA